MQLLFGTDADTKATARQLHMHASEHARLQRMDYENSAAAHARQVGLKNRQELDLVESMKMNHKYANIQFIKFRG